MAVNCYAGCGSCPEKGSSSVPLWKGQGLRGAFLERVTPAVLSEEPVEIKHMKKQGRIFHGESIARADMETPQKARDPPRKMDLQISRGKGKVCYFHTLGE